MRDGRDAVETVHKLWIEQIRARAARIEANDLIGVAVELEGVFQLIGRRMVG